MKVFKIFIVLGLVLFVVIHTSFTLLYILPENIVSYNVKTKTKKYMFPFFDQGWALFAPVPEVNKKVFVSYEKADGTWSDWQAPFNKYMYSHWSKRVSVSGKMVLSVSSALHYLYHENAPQLQERKNICADPRSGFYRVLNYEVGQELANNGLTAKKIKLLVVFTKADCGKPETYSLYYVEHKIEK